MDHASQGGPDSTALNACRFSSIMAVAMTMSAAVAHLMELPAKTQYEPHCMCGFTARLSDVR
jgi:hypothetical protein